MAVTRWNLRWAVVLWAPLLTTAWMAFHPKGWVRGNEPPTLLTDRLLLRPLALGDAEAVFAYASDGEVTRYVTFEAHRSVEDARAFLRSVTEGYARGGPGWGIVLRDDGRLVGTCALEVAREYERRELGYVNAASSRAAPPPVPKTAVPRPPRR